MKKCLVLLLLAFFAISSNLMAQNWLYKSVSGYRQRNQQRIYQQNRRQSYPNRQQTYLNRQRFEQQRLIDKQRSNNQRDYKQQQQSDANTVGTNSMANESSIVNNTNQSNEKVLSLVTNGTGSTKDEATRNALRSAIEQAYGTFVSANTQVLNDELIKDQIVTISNGNIKSYRELSISQTLSGLYDVSVQATVSIDQLTKFAQSKGMQAELAGASFTMNMKMRELNKKNEIAAINNMIEKAKAIAQNGLFDYKLELGEPRLTENSNYAIKVKIIFYENDNTRAFYNTIYNTFNALSLSKSEIAEYQRANLSYYVYDKQLVPNYGMYALRNNYEGIVFRDASYRFPCIMPMFMKYALNYKIKDNIGNVWSCKIEKVENSNENYEKCQRIEKQSKLIWGYDEHNNDLRKNRYYYMLYPSDRIAQAGKTRREEGMVFNVPIRDYNNDFYVPNLHFNPLTKANPFDDAVEGRIKTRYYYEQEFFIIYSENELSRLKSITIEHNR